MFYQCIEGELVIGVQRYVPERSAELFCLSKQVFRAFGSCNGHVTAITSGVELNVKGKFLLLFCCYCSTLQHCLGLKGLDHAPAETSRLSTVSFPAWPAAALTTSQLVAASSRTAPGGGRSHPRLEPGGPTLVVEQLGILLVGGESSQLSQGRRLGCQWTWVTGRSPPLPMRGKELSNTIGHRGDKELRGHLYSWVRYEQN